MLCARVRTGVCTRVISVASFYFERLIAVFRLCPPSRKLLAMCAFISEERELIEEYEEMWVSYNFIFKLSYSYNVLTELINVDNVLVTHLAQLANSVSDLITTKQLTNYIDTLLISKRSWQEFNYCMTRNTGLKFDWTFTFP